LGCLGYESKSYKANFVFPVSEECAEEIEEVKLCESL
jgi:hypothetical protein